MNISMEEYQKTVEYQYPMNVDVKNITNIYIYIWRPVYEVPDASFFEETGIFLQDSHAE